MHVAFDARRRSLGFFFWLSLLTYLERAYKNESNAGQECIAATKTAEKNGPNNHTNSRRGPPQGACFRRSTLSSAGNSPRQSQTGSGAPPTDGDIRPSAPIGPLARRFTDLLTCFRQERRRPVIIVFSLHRPLQGDHAEQH